MPRISRCMAPPRACSTSELRASTRRSSEPPVGFTKLVRLGVPLGTNSWLLRSSSFEEAPLQGVQAPSRPRGASNLGSHHGHWTVAVPKFRPWAAHGPLSLQNPEASCDSMPPPPQRLAQTLVCVIQAFPAIGHGLSGSKTQRSQSTGVLERSFLDRQTFWNQAFGVEELAEDLAPCGESHEDAARPDHDSGQAVRPIIRAR